MSALPVEHVTDPLSLMTASYDMQQRLAMSLTGYSFADLVDAKNKLIDFRSVSCAVGVAAGIAVPIVFVYSRRIFQVWNTDKSMTRQSWTSTRGVSIQIVGPSGFIGSRAVLDSMGRILEGVAFSEDCAISVLVPANHAESTFNEDSWELAFEFCMRGVVPVMASGSVTDSSGWQLRDLHVKASFAKDKKFILYVRDDQLPADAPVGAITKLNKFGAVATPAGRPIIAGTPAAFLLYLSLQMYGARVAEGEAQSLEAQRRNQALERMTPEQLYQAYQARLKETAAEKWKDLEGSLRGANEAAFDAVIEAFDEVKFNKANVQYLKQAYQVVDTYNLDTDDDAKKKTAWTKVFSEGKAALERRWGDFVAIDKCVNIIVSFAAFIAVHARAHKAVAEVEPRKKHYAPGTQIQDTLRNPFASRVAVRRQRLEEDAAEPAEPDEEPKPTKKKGRSLTLTSKATSADAAPPASSGGTALAI